jgi:hypothetical protein
VLPVLMDVLQGRRGVRVGKVNSPAPLRLEPKTPDGERKS